MKFEQIFEIQKQKKILEVCDQVRDQVLVKLGVRLEDKDNNTSVWKLEDPEILLLEQQQKEFEKQRKEEARLEQARKDAERESKAKILPEQLFRQNPNEYAQFDENGIPTHNAENEPLSKNQRKGLEKEYQKQKKLYEKYMEKNSSK